MNILECKKQIYNEMKFTLEEIHQGEMIYNSLATTQSKEQFVEIYHNSYKGQSKDGFWVLDNHTKLPNEVKIAIINFATHEPTTDVTLDPKVVLARNLFHSFNGRPVQGPQELFDIACWWIDFETNEKVRGALVTALIEFTTVYTKAKQKILELIPKDPIAIESLNFWLTHNFPRNYDYVFGQQVEQEIDKYFLAKISIDTNQGIEPKFNQPYQAGELLAALEKKGFKVSYETYLKQNSDPRENSMYEQPSITIGSNRIDLWNTLILYIEESNLICFLAESKVVRWGVEITIANVRSLEIASLPLESCYEGEASVIRSRKDFFFIRFKQRAVSVDVSGFPKIKLIDDESKKRNDENPIIQPSIETGNDKSDKQDKKNHITTAKKKSNRGNSYQPSGKVGGLAWVYLLLVCGVVLPLVGAVYALIIWYLPLIIFNPFITIIFIIAIIITHSLLVIECGKVRNVRWATVSGHIALATALYAHWLVWIVLADGKQQLVNGTYYFLTHPFDLANTIWKVNQSGTWWGPGGKWHGWPLAIIWVVEALIVYYWVISSIKKKVEMPFSEANQEWFKPSKPLIMQYVIDTSKFTEDFSNDQIEQLNRLRKAESEKASHSVFLFHFSTKEEYYLSIDNYPKSDGNANKLIGEKVLKYFKISAEAGRKLQELEKQHIKINAEARRHQKDLEKQHIIILEGASPSYSQFNPNPNIWSNKMALPKEIQEKTSGKPSIWIDQKDSKICFCFDGSCIAFKAADIKAFTEVESGQDPDRGNRFTSTELCITMANAQTKIIFTAGRDFDYKLAEIQKITGIPSKF